MKAVIPVAGFGTRMRPHTLTHPKVLLPVADKPMIGHIVEKLIDDGVDGLVFVVGHLGDKVEEYIRNSFKIKSHFIEQKEFLGLGHAIYTAGDFLTAEPLIIVLGDTLYDVDLKSVIGSDFSSLGVKEVDDPRRFGVAVTGKDGFITRLVEKPQKFVSKLALVGLYYFTNGEKLKQALEELIAKNIRTKNEYQLTDALQIMIDRGEKMGVFNVDGWYDCGKPETLLETNGIILRQRFADKKYQYKDSIIIPPVFIHPEAEIEKAVIGPEVTIGANCKISQSVIRNTIIGEYTIIKNIVLQDSLIGEHTFVKGEIRELNLGDYSRINFE